jgi:tryptophan 2,3-dioxygenase
MKNSYTGKEQYYGDYLALDKILNAQFPESDVKGVDAHDEMLFIIIHQAYELWFKQIMHETTSVINIFKDDNINDNSEAMQVVTHRLERVVEIWKLLVAQVKVLDTMTPMDFLDFRDLLTPASGFQSYQFRLLETKLGLKMEQRFEQKYYQKQLREEHIEGIEEAEKESSVFELLDKWLSRMPFWNEEKYWNNFEIPSGADKNLHPFWSSYRYVYQSGLMGSEKEEIAMKSFDELFFSDQEQRPVRLSAAASRAALFINLYREFPLLQQPYRLLSLILEIDELMATFRYKHIIMVRRMIGMRSGTGGSSGAGYLQGAMEKHQIFAEIAGIATYLIPRTKLPKLTAELSKVLSFHI